MNLIKSYGISEQEIINEFGDLNASKITLAAELILQEEYLLQENQTMDILDHNDYSIVLSVFGINTLNATTVGGCLGEAAGIKIVQDALQSGIKGLGKKGALKILKKVASKYVGWVGVAVMAVEFSECMGWTNFY